MVSILPNMKPIPNWPKYYAGENGRIYLQSVISKQLVSNVKRDSKGLLTVPLIDMYGKRHTCYVHSLIAETWLENPISNQENYYQFELKHKNKNQLDNRVENLYWEPIEKSNFLRQFLHWSTKCIFRMHKYEQ